MKRMTRRLIGGLAAGLLPAAAALAAVTAVTTTPPAERAAPGRATSVAFAWNVTTDTAGSVTVSSPAGELRSPSGTLLGTVNRPLERTTTGPGSVTFAETVLVPAAAVEGARREGHDRLFYRRAFTDGAAASGEIEIHIAASSSAAFGVSRIALGFEDGKPVETVARGEELRARAQVSYTGAGILRGAWEIAGPDPDPDGPVWRVLAQTTRGLPGGESATIASPALPADIAGFYLVRLRVAEPAPAFDAPVVRYVVGPE